MKLGWKVAIVFNLTVHLISKLWLYCILLIAYMTSSVRKNVPIFPDFSGKSNCVHKNWTNHRKSDQKQQAYIIYARINRWWCRLCLLSFILTSFYFLAIFVPTSPFSSFHEARHWCCCNGCGPVSVLPSGTPSPLPPMIRHLIRQGGDAEFIRLYLAVDRDKSIFCIRPFTFCRGWDTVINF